MKRLICLLIWLVTLKTAFTQVSLPILNDSLFSTYYHQRVSHFRTLPKTNGDIIFIGNSITDGGEWGELFNDTRVKNRGISGDITAGVLNRIDEVAKRRPAKVFLLIGVNDIARNLVPDSIVKNILWIAAYLKQESPSTLLFVQSILPVNDAFGKFGGHTSKVERIKEVNARLKEQAKNQGYNFLDLYSSFTDERGKLKKELTNDGLHLKGQGYQLWKHLVYPFVYGLQQQPSLLPLPQKLEWREGNFPLYECKSIVMTENSISKEAGWLQAELQKIGLNLSIEKKEKPEEKSIVLDLGNVVAPTMREEAYRMNVTAKKVVITANTPHGLFNGIQTFMQLARDGSMIDACSITDWPAFAWRGYMIDVGRNYMSMELLKQQIDVMTRYKLNVFHFHPTEDIAWRIEIHQYPGLTAPENMLRNKGMFYSREEIKDLIAYCKERHIVFVPEIDMPGHSAAFRRALKTDMQSDSGIVIVKNILEELTKTFDLPYVHIGADEVKITNKNFIPEVTAYLESLGKKVIGWQPGGNFSPGTIRQLWMDDNGRITGDDKIQYIDSRHLYLNHMDPLESVVTIYNRRIGNKVRGDASALGGTICMWHDRAVGKDEDILRMNPVYPAMLAFSERCWRGGGIEGWVANLGDGDVEGFHEFESRLLDHKHAYFADKPFAYSSQSGMVWKLFGPFDNEGEPGKKFLPELRSKTDSLPSFKEVRGGTIVLRHWWAPLIKGAIGKADDSTTWYASTEIWSDEAVEKNFWIGFNNLSR
jgi:lysophospholipase L1-like esterase